MSSTPAPPPLPDDLPSDLRQFVDCKADNVELRGGKAKWIPVPPVLSTPFSRFMKPSAQIEPMPDGHSARLVVGWRMVSLHLVAKVIDGRLELTPDGAGGGLLADVYDGVEGWVTQLNDWIAHNGYRLESADVERDRIRLVKQPVKQHGSAPHSH